MTFANIFSLSVPCLILWTHNRNIYITELANTTNQGFSSELVKPLPVHLCIHVPTIHWVNCLPLSSKMFSPVGEAG